MAQSMQLKQVLVTYKNRLLHYGFKIQVSLPGNIESWEQVPNETHEYWDIICHNLWSVKVSQSTHQNLDTVKDSIEYVHVQ